MSWPWQLGTMLVVLLAVWAGLEWRLHHQDEDDDDKEGAP